MRTNLMSIASVVLTKQDAVIDCEKRAGIRSDAKTSRAHTLQTNRRRAGRRSKGCRLLGPRTSRLRGQGLSDRAQDLCRPEPRAGRIEAHYPRPAWRAHHRAGAQTGGCRHRPHQKGREPSGGTAGARVHRGRSGTALPGDACGGELQRAHCGYLPRVAPQPHPAGTRRNAGRIGWPAGGSGAALRAPRHPPRCEPGTHGAVQDVLVGRRLGAGAGWRQPLPLRAQVQGRHARAVPHAGRVSAAGPGVVLSRCPWPVADARGGGIAVVDADRMPAQRDFDAGGGTTWTEGRQSCACATPRPARAWCR